MRVQGSGKAGKQTVGVATRAESEMISPTCRKQKTNVSETRLVTLMLPPTRL